MIDHALLLRMLEDRYGIGGTVHKWFKSYLSDRTQTVIIQGVSLDSQPLNLGVPQGSVLGPVLFTLYSAPIAEIARKYGLRVHLYADDTQLYVSFSSGEAVVTVARVEQCEAEIKAWLVAHKLKLNDDKTVIMQIVSPRSTASLLDCHVLVGDDRISLSDAATNLGVDLDQHFNMQAQVKKVCRTAYTRLKNIAKIRSVLPQKTAETLVHALITSKLDYCNALMYGLPASTTTSLLQYVQNSAARVVMRTRKFDHITSVLRDLHWLQVEDRIIFKILMITYRALHGLAPDYISDLVVPYVPPRSLRSANENLLVVPSSRLRSFGDRRFAYAAPTLWNSLPLKIRNAQSLTQFKGLLKTHLFVKTYCQ